MNSTLVLTPEMLNIARTAPEPLPGLPPVMPFDLNLLPNALRPYAADVSERMQCPIDFVGASLMAALSAAVGRRRSVYAKRNDNWRVVPNLWCAIIGRPSAMKSPALSASMIALKRIDRQMAEDYQEALKVAQIDADMAGLSAKDANTKAQAAMKKGDTGTARSLLENAQQGEVVEPVQTRLIESDATVEALQMSMAASPNGLLLYRDELAGWLQKLEQEDQAEARSFYLVASTGRESFTQRRIGRGITNIDSCVLSIIGGIQPARIAKVTKAAVSGASDDGLIQRFQLAVWPDDNHRYRHTDQAPNAKAEMLYQEIFETLHSLEYLEAPLRMTSEAIALFAEWSTSLNLEIRAGEMHTALQSHLLKSSETVLAIALLCELADDPEATEVGADAIRRALAWATYLRSHAQRLYHHGSDAAMVAAKLILSKKKDLKDGFSARDLRRKCWSGLDAEVIAPAIEVLIDYGHLYEIEVTNNCRPTFKYQWEAL
jgi:hypothetical protein